MFICGLEGAASMKAHLLLPCPPRIPYTLQLWYSPFSIDAALRIVASLSMGEDVAKSRCGAMKPGHTGRLVQQMWSSPKGTRKGTGFARGFRSTATEIPVGDEPERAQTFRPQASSRLVAGRDSQALTTKIEPAP